MALKNAGSCWPPLGLLPSHCLQQAVHGGRSAVRFSMAKSETFDTREGAPLPIRYEPRLDVPPEPKTYPGGPTNSDKGTLANVPTQPTDSKAGPS